MSVENADMWRMHAQAFDAFINELYAIMVDPCAEGTIKRDRAMQEIKDAALRDRERAACQHVWHGTEQGCRRCGAPLPAPTTSSEGGIKTSSKEILDNSFDTPSSDRSTDPFQERVLGFVLACFSAAIAADKVERNHRFLEEALELVQAIGCTASEAHQLVDYVYGRPAGEPHLEAGGVMVTLAALCTANGLNMVRAGEDELARVWGKIDVIREKQRKKPKHSPLPEVAPNSATSPSNWVPRAAKDTLALTATRGYIPWSKPDDPCGGQHVEEMLAKLERGEITGMKAHRWLGWAQAIVCEKVGVPLEELKAINKRASSEGTGS